METQLATRAAEVPYVNGITRWVIGTSYRDLAAPDGTWDLVVLRHDGATTILLTGQTTRAVPLHFAPGHELLTISFRASAFLPMIAPQDLRDKAILLPCTRTRLRLGPDSFEIPTFENAEQFCHALTRKGQICQDDLVDRLLLNRPAAYSLRTIQRRFLQTTGITHSLYRQIQRAREAADRIQRGQAAADVAYAVGYADQAHMARSLKRLLGQGPSEIATRPRI